MVDGPLLVLKIVHLSQLPTGEAFGVTVRRANGLAAAKVALHEAIDEEVRHVQKIAGQTGRIGIIGIAPDVFVVQYLDVDVDYWRMIAIAS